MSVDSISGTGGACATFVSCNETVSGSTFITGLPSGTVGFRCRPVSSASRNSLADAKRFSRRA